MSSRLLAYGLILNLAALVGIVALGVAIYVTSFYDAWFGSPLVGQILWGLFAASSLLCWRGSPRGARLGAGLLFATTLVSGYFFFLATGPGSRGIGSIFAMLTLVLYCMYQGMLAKEVQDLTSLELLKRAYTRPLVLFFGSFGLGWLCDATGFDVPTPYLVVVMLGCPIWAFAYLGVVNVHLIKAVQRPPTEGLALDPEGPSGL